MTRPTLEAILADARRRASGLHERRRDLERRAREAPPARPFGVPFRGALVGVIAEVKRRSPSAGPIRPSLDPVTHAGAYVAGGAVAISVLTDERHFGGSLDDLARVAEAVSVPVLRKDFVVDELQLLESRGGGASVVLLIVRALPPADLRSLATAARGYGLATLVEAHTQAELDLALSVDPDAIGVNSRDLGTYAVSLDVAERLVTRVPRDTLAVAESGIEQRADVERLAKVGADLVLVGTAVARADDPTAAVRALTGVPRVERSA
ncbi:MAG TPA: indole-3-glycerol phosphate synthase TrpC [Gemmatimonadales bacterium]